MPVLVYFILLWDAIRGARPRARSAGEQARVDGETAKLTLYHFQACPYCRKVRRDIRLLGLEVPMRDIKRDPSAHADLVGGGGKRQVPCLRIPVDGGGARWLYESRHITRYLRERFT